jgi:hypothetical protein
MEAWHKPDTTPWAMCLRLRSPDAEAATCLNPKRGIILRSLIGMSNPTDESR